MTTITVDIPSAMWLSSNHRHGNPHAKARKVADIRLLGRHAARDTPPIVGPVHITIYVGTPTARRFDAPNAWDSAKPAIDGIVDAGVLADDSSDIVPRTSFEMDPERTPRGRYRLTIHITTPRLQCHDPAPKERIEGVCTACMRVDF